MIYMLGLDYDKIIDLGKAQLSPSGASMAAAIAEEIKAMPGVKDAKWFDASDVSLIHGAVHAAGFCVYTTNDARCELKLNALTFDLDSFSIADTAKYIYRECMKHLKRIK